MISIRSIILFAAVGVVPLGCGPYENPGVGQGGRSSESGGYAPRTPPGAQPEPGSGVVGATGSLSEEASRAPLQGTGGSGTGGFDMVGSRDWPTEGWGPNPDGIRGSPNVSHPERVRHGAGGPPDVGAR